MFKHKRVHTVSTGPQHPVQTVFCCQLINYGSKTLRKNRGQSELIVKHSTYKFQYLRPVSYTHLDVYKRQGERERERERKWAHSKEETHCLIMNALRTSNIE